MNPNPRSREAVKLGCLCPIHFVPRKDGEGGEQENG